MDIIQIVVIGLVSTILALILKKQSPEIALMVSIAASVLIFFSVIPKFDAVLSVLKDLSSNVSIGKDYIYTIFKIIGIAYIAEFGAQLCKDAGESSIASKIELSGKVLIMVISAPIIMSLLNLILVMLP